ncbi:DUF402 domain-containing protein [Nocardia brasiliensis]|uniref:DUF402 domain-containing protein n=1 Tax=Nocardia brasiliensis TaxID=37326 RepID=UPI0004A723A3|nr:DUF402 domain-containing protein [Nocardia brasiliensis]MBF6127459.1 DUF402 domain-containing protein [Nocardia brasiliensis]MBF6547232.1 DUF402 domain-containing protein [Nocardia brasiliensis]
MRGLIPLLNTAPTTGFAGNLARHLRAAVPGLNHSGPAANPPNALPPGQPPHRPHVEFFNLAELTSTDNKGFVRQVERYHHEPWGLYMARIVPVPHHHYLECWLLPELSLRVTVTRRNPAHHVDHDFHLDIGEFTEIAPKRWKAVDHYLDIEVHRGRDVELRGVDDLLAAHAAGLVDSAQAHRAFECATAALDGLAVNDHCVEDWLATRGITLTWM